MHRKPDKKDRTFLILDGIFCFKTFRFIWWHQQCSIEPFIAESMTLWIPAKHLKNRVFFQGTFSTAQIHILCFKACQILIFSVIRFEVAVGRKTFPTLSALQILPKTITSPHFPLSKAPDLDITNSNLGDPVICQYSNFNLGNIILTRLCQQASNSGRVRCKLVKIPWKYNFNFQTR